MPKTNTSNHGTIIVVAGEAVAVDMMGDETMLGMEEDVAAEMEPHAAEQDSTATRTEIAPIVGLIVKLRARDTSRPQLWPTRWEEVPGTVSDGVGRQIIVLKIKKNYPYLSSRTNLIFHKPHGVCYKKRLFLHRLFLLLATSTLLLP